LSRTFFCPSRAYLAVLIPPAWYLYLLGSGTLFAKQFNPSRTIAFGARTWSIAATCMAATQNRAGVFVCRLFIGVGEAFFGQAMAL
jgi:hypothetical protein